MKQLLLILSFFSFYLVTYSQDTIQGQLLKGVIRAELDSNYLMGVHVININNRTGTVTDQNGNYTINVNAGDRILFSYLGFELDTLHVHSWMLNDTVIKITMKETTYLLSIFDALSIKTFEDFEKAFLALELKEERINFSIPKPDVSYNLPQNAGFTIAIPFDLSYFTKKGRDLRRYQALLEKDNYEQMIKIRYNATVVEKVTGIKDPQKISELMNYCDFSDQFIRNAIDYDLYVAIIECSKTYERKKSLEKKTKAKEE